MLVKREARGNWYCAEGVALKRAYIEKKGIPNMRFWRFFTLTIDPSQFEDEVDAYLAGKERMRRWLDSTRSLLGLSHARWAWKLEFHESGWPHWHVAFDYRKKLSQVEMKAIEGAWGIGSTNVEMIRNGTLAYLFKYASKEAYRNTEPGREETDMLPSWFLDYANPVEGGLQETFARVRFWQTSAGFYTGDRKESPPKKESTCTLLSFTVRENISRSLKSVRVIARSRDGAPLKSCTIRLKSSWRGGIDIHFASLSALGLAAPVSRNSYSCTKKEILALCQRQQNQTAKLKRVMERDKGLHRKEAREFQDALLLSQGIPF